MLYQGIIGGGSSPVEPVDLSPVLLWTNSNPGATFAAQTVSLDLTEYAGVIVEFNRSSSSDAQTFANRSFIKKGETGLGGGNTVAVTPASRNVSCSNTGVTFEGGYSGTNPNDNAVIPTKIYGVKEYVVEVVTGNKVVDSGSLDVNFTTQQKIVHVSFNEQFTIAPTIGRLFIQTETINNSKELTVKAASISTTGFDITVYSHTLSGTEKIHWVVLQDALF